MRVYPLALAPLLLAAPAAAHQEVEPWPTLFVSGALGDGWQASGEVIERVAADRPRPSQLELRLHVGHAIGKRAILWVGYVHVDTFNEFARNGKENQAVEQLSVNLGAAGPFRLSSRTRLEQRFIRGAGGEVQWRFRQQVRVALPLVARGPSAVAWAEPFVELNRTPPVRRTFDQLRTFAGLSLPITRNADVEIGYLNQYLIRPGKNTSNDVIPLVVNLRF